MLAGAAGRHASRNAFPARRARCRRRLGPLQRDRGRRPRHPPGARRLARRRAALHHLGGGAAHVRRVARPAHALAQGLDADLSRAHALAPAPVAGAGAAALPRPAGADGRPHPVGAGASLVLRAGGARSLAGAAVRRAELAARADAVVDRRLQCDRRLRQRHRARRRVGGAARPPAGLPRMHALMPVYWLGISFAAYRALVQLVSAPYYWEKTEHFARAARCALRCTGSEHREPPIAAE